MTGCPTTIVLNTPPRWPTSKHCFGPADLPREASQGMRDPSLFDGVESLGSKQLDHGGVSFFTEHEPAQESTRFVARRTELLVVTGRVSNEQTVTHGWKLRIILDHRQRLCGQSQCSWCRWSCVAGGFRVPRRHLKTLDLALRARSTLDPYLIHQSAQFGQGFPVGNTCCGQKELSN